MKSSRHLIISIFLSLFTFTSGVVGYMIIEGWPILDSIYMTAITLSTVGYSEVHPVSQTGQIFTILLVISGVGFTMYVAGAIIQFLVEGRMRSLMGRKRLNSKIKRIKDHFIVCGYGRIGRVLSQHLAASDIKQVVLDSNADYVDIMDKDGALYIIGDATEEDNLLAAGIERAKGLVAALGSDTENVFLVLTARQLNPDLYIVARSSSVKDTKKLIAAGADKVESPYAMGAASMAQRILRPTVTSFLNLALTSPTEDIQMEEIPVSAESELVDVMLKDSGIRQRFNLILIAIKKEDGQMIFNPSFEARVNGGDTVIVVGQRANLRGLSEALNPGLNNSLALS